MSPKNWGNKTRLIKRHENYRKLFHSKASAPKTLCEEAGVSERLCQSADRAEGDVLLKVFFFLLHRVTLHFGKVGRLTNQQDCVMNCHGPIETIIDVLLNVQDNNKITRSWIIYKRWLMLSYLPTGFLQIFQQLTASFAGKMQRHRKNKERVQHKYNFIYECRTKVTVPQKDIIKLGRPLSVISVW